MVLFLTLEVLQQTASAEIIIVNIYTVKQGVMNRHCRIMLRYVRE